MNSIEEKAQNLLFLEESNSEQLREVLSDLLDEFQALQEHNAEIETDPKRNVALAQALVCFAEWHNSGYKTSMKTREIVGQVLWDEVSTHVQHILGYAPEDVGPASGQLDLFALSA